MPPSLPNCSYRRRPAPSTTTIGARASAFCPLPAFRLRALALDDEAAVAESDADVDAMREALAAAQEVGELGRSLRFSIFGDARDVSVWKLI